MEGKRREGRGRRWGDEKRVKTREGGAREKGGLEKEREREE